MKKKQFYAVVIGRTTGVFSNWEETSKSVTRFPGNLYKGFPTKEEAVNWYLIQLDALKKDD